MFIFNKLRSIFNHAGSTKNIADDERRNCSPIHTFPSRRERAISDIRCIELHIEKIANESSGVANCRTLNPVCNLIPGFGELISKRSGESSVYWNAAENAYYKVKNPAAKAQLKRTSQSDWPYEHVIHNILSPI